MNSKYSPVEQHFHSEKVCISKGLQEKIDDSMEQIRRGEYVEMLPGETLDDMLRRAGFDL